MSTTLTPAPAPAHRAASHRTSAGAFSWSQLWTSLPGAFRKLDPRQEWRNPVMFLVWVGAVLITVLAVVELFIGPAASGGTVVPRAFTWAIAVWLWLTVLFANLAESVAEGRGKAQADSLRQTRTSTTAHRIADPAGLAADPGAEHLAVRDVPSSDLQLHDTVVVSAGELIPGDGDVIQGIASVDESAITGESAPVIRESGGDRSAVTGGTRVLSDRIVVRITSKPGQTFVDRMIALVEGANRQRTPNEIALSILLASLSIIFVVVILTLDPIASFDAEPASLTALVALLVCLIPTTIGALLSAIGIAGMDRLVQHNVLAMSGRAVEAAGDVTTLLMDKTGTITLGNRRATAFVPVSGVAEDELIAAAARSSLADPTPEGTSIVELARSEGVRVDDSDPGTIVPFTAQTRMSGLDLPDGTEIRKGAASAVTAWLQEGGGRLPSHQLTEIKEHTDHISADGGTPLVVARRDPAGHGRLLGVVHLKDIVKEGLTERFAELRAMGIRTVMITGDNPLTAAAIAEEAGVDDFVAEAVPEDKLALIRSEQAGGNMVAMTGDGTNDAPALAQADVGVAMNTGTSAAKEAGNMVDLDSDPTKLIDIVRIGKQLLITRGALTTFSIANDVAKYFAIIPAMFMGIYPGLAAVNVMGLHSPASAVLSAVIFNAIIIVLLVPLALRGVQYRALSASQTLNRNLLIYGVGGIVAPFVGIWLIDLLIRLIPGF